MIRGGRIEHEVMLEHPPERVWRALVDPAELGAWLMPNDFLPQPGRRFTLDARPELGLIDGEVLEAIAPRLLRCRWSGAFGDTIVQFTLTPAAGAGTRLRLEHYGWADERRVERDGFHGGWHDKLTTDLPAALTAISDRQRAQHSPSAERGRRDDERGRRNKK